MGKLKNKHNHALTEWLKVIIFGFVMLAPFFAILSKCLYVACNKNAKNSYYGETINETIYKKINYNNLVANESYNLTNEILSTMTATSQSAFYISDLQIIAPQVSFDYSNATQLRYYVNSEGIPRVYIYNNNNIGIGRPFDLNNENINFYFKYLGSNNVSFNATLLSALDFTIETYNNYSYLDNVFEYAVNQLGETQIFSWTKNTGIYTPINNMTTGLGFNTENNTLAILLTYWALNTAIYIVFDIVLVCFVKLTHLVND